MYPLAYLLTFRCHGTWLPGDPRGYVNRWHNSPGTRAIAANRRLEAATLRQLPHPPIELRPEQRAVVARAIRDRCRHCGWVLHAVNVRTNHVHVVLGAGSPPERVMNQLKSWATRRMV